MRRGALLFPLLVACLDAGAAGFHDTLAEMRAGLLHCPASAVPQLRPSAALDRAAAGLARGGELEQSLKQSGYRAARSSAISVTGSASTAAAFLARQGYCRQLQDAGFTEAGLYQDAKLLWIVLAAPFAPSAGVSTGAGGQRVLELVNEARAHARRCGGKGYAAARPLHWNDALAKAAQRHADDMARYNYLSHTGRDGSNPGKRVERAGYRYRMTGENIAGGSQMTPEVAVAGWIKSPAHCANLMHPDYTEMGAAFAVDPRSDFGVYWAQNFGAPR